jgi:hypothetical protein
VARMDAIDQKYQAIRYGAIGCREPGGGPSNQVSPRMVEGDGDRVRPEFYLEQCRSGHKRCSGSFSQAEGPWEPGDAFA